MTLPHGVHIFVSHRRRLDCRLEIERDEAGLHARFGEFLQHLVLGLADPFALPVLGERRDVRPLARDPLLRAGIAVQVNDAHAGPPSPIALFWTPCRSSRPENRPRPKAARAASTSRSPWSLVSPPTRPAL